MRVPKVLLLGLAILVIARPTAVAQASLPSLSAPPSIGPTAERTRTVLQQYCLPCHNQKLRTADLAFDRLGLSDVPSKADTWEKVIRKLRTRTMPPTGRPRPDVSTYDGVASWLEGQIDRVAAARPNPGRTETVHRLNRSEYQNAVRDLLDVEIDASKLLPADDQSYGFDNIAGVLKMSPTLLERYLSAAREVTRLAAGDPRIAPRADTYRLRMDYGQYDHVDGLPLGTRGGTAIRYTFPADGEYSIKVVGLGLQESPGAVFREDHQLEITVDDQRMKLFYIKKDEDDRDQTSADFVPPSRVWEVRTPVKAGAHVVGATFVQISDALGETIRQPFARPHSEGDFLLFEPHIGTVTISGPFNPASRIYKLGNTGTNVMNWSAEATVGWVDFSDASGTLAVSISGNIAEPSE